MAPCKTCVKAKRKCEYESEAAPACVRCSRLGRFPCEPSSPPPAGEPTPAEPGAAPAPAPRPKSTKRQTKASDARVAVPDGAKGPVAGAGDSTRPAAPLPTGPAPAAHVDRGIAEPVAVPPETMFACMAAWWAVGNQCVALVHRDSFERAFAGADAPSPIYGGKPAALLSAAAAEGVMIAALSDIALAERLSLGGVLSRRARDLLFAGYFDRSPGSRAMTDLEAAQTCVILARNLVGSHRGPEAGVLLDRALAILGSSIGPWGESAAAEHDPKDKDEWVRQECLLRVRTNAVFAKLALILHSGGDRPPLSARVALPCHEVYFSMGSAEEAFALLRARRRGALRRVVDQTPFLAYLPDPDACAGAVASFVSPIFDFSTSRFSVIWLFIVLIGLVRRTRDIEAEASLDLARLAAQDPRDDSPAELAYRTFALALDRTLRAIVDALPPPVGASLSDGDPGPLLSLQNTYPSAPQQNHALLSMLISLYALPTYTWLGPRPDPAVFGAPPLLALLEHALLATSLMRAQMDRRGIPWAHLSAVGSSLKVCGLWIAVAGASAGEQRELSLADARTAARYFLGAGSAFPGAVGQMFPRIEGMFDGAGLAFSDREAAGGAPKAAFGEIVHAPETALRDLYVVGIAGEMPEAEAVVAAK
ncbi:hypothetical protein DFJ74DRAFT_682182 [Hyaloraphidium curvatum]|nr:hypothetical protein DFJ74DRAFT_682182 [Hyaloraphidium curvatum]